MNKTYNFLSSLPRTGSTLLASILNQHPDIHASGTSALLELLTSQSDLINIKRTFYGITGEQELNIYKGIIDSYYQHINKPNIFDKHRSWPTMILPLKKMGIDMKIIITLRPIAEIVASYITLIDKHTENENFIDILLKQRNLEITTMNRAMVIWSDYISIPHSVITNTIKNNRGNMCFLQYDDIVNHPQETLNKVCDFCNVNRFDGFDFNKIENTQPEMDDGGWRIKDLHKIRGILKKESIPPEEVIGEELTKYFNQFNINV